MKKHNIVSSIEDPFKEVDEYASLSAKLFSLVIKEIITPLNTPETYFPSSKLSDLVYNYSNTASFNPLNAANHLINILNRYQEVPVYLDKYIEDLVKLPIELIEAFITLSQTSSNRSLFNGSFEGELSAPVQYTEEYNASFNKNSNKTEIPELILILFNLLSQIAKVRGYKKIYKFFSSNPQSLEPILSFMLFTSNLPDKHKYSNVRIVLLNWLSLLANIPIELSIIDSNSDLLTLFNYNKNDYKVFSDPFSSDISSTLSHALVIISLSHCKYSIGNESLAASRLFSQLIKRKDVTPVYLARSFDFFISSLKEYSSSIHNPSFPTQKSIMAHQANNILTCISCVLKILAMVTNDSNSQLISSKLEEIWSLISTTITSNNSKNAISLSNKLLSKVSQRIGIFFIQTSIVDDTIHQTILSIVSYLLDISTNSKETVVRWSAVKGVSRISKFSNSPEFVSQIISHLLHHLASSLSIDFSLMKDNPTFTIESLAFDNKFLSKKLRSRWWSHVDLSMSTDSSWHGSILCFAELIRLNLCGDSETLTKLIPFLLIALKYENLRNNNLIGDNVRDAACYMSWCLARTELNFSVSSANENNSSLFHTNDPHDVLDSDESASHIFDLEFLISCLGQDLVSAMLFDREVHVRRAASAAFQEYAGRQHSPIQLELPSSRDQVLSETEASGLDGSQRDKDIRRVADLSFKHGLSVLLLADYYAVGNLHNIPKIARQISLYSEYRSSMISHLFKFSLMQPNKLLQTIATTSISEIISVNDKNGCNMIEGIFIEQMPTLIASCNRPESSIRVGAILGIKSLFINIEPFRHIIAASETNPLIHQLIEDTLNLPNKIKPVFLKGLVGSDDLLIALCELCKVLSFNNKIDFMPHFNLWITEIFFLALSKDNHDLQVTCSNILSEICTFNRDAIISVFDLVTEILKILDSSSPVSKNGFTLALSVCGIFNNSEKIRPIVESYLLNVIQNGSIDTLPNSKLISGADKQGAYVKPIPIELVRNATISLGKLIQNIPATSYIDHDIISLSLKCLLEFGLSNYRSDHRGDVGSWVRLASINSLIQIIKSNPRFFISNFDIYELAMGKALEMCVSLQSNLRSRANDLINTLLLLNTFTNVDSVKKENKCLHDSKTKLDTVEFYSEKTLYIFKIGKALYHEFPNLEPQIDHVSTKSVFDIYSKVLYINSLPNLILKLLMRGIVSAIGNISEMFSQASSSSILKVFDTLNSDAPNEVTRINETNFFNEKQIVNDELSDNNIFTESIQIDKSEKELNTCKLKQKDRLLSVFAELFQESLTIKRPEYSRINVACLRFVELIIIEDIFDKSQDIEM
ncbi:Tubulin-specific chaperone D [Smittium culicis]|uniref:Tubulin-specific chaperone D n=1 Tax=Smittium culicis TaxID=133412 RepID=A0A1R1XX79_9FUNG|nr:Tubulin-specific chaperone D [Smittium culicis]